MKLKIAALFAGAVGAILLTRGKSPGNVTVTEVRENGSVESFELPAVDLVGQVVESVKEATASVTNVIFGTKYDALIESSAKQYGIEPAILYKLLYQESRFRDDIITGKVRSSAGALGIAQFMPATAAQELGSVDAALDPMQAIPGAARYLAKLIRATGSTTAGVAAYNWGIGNVQRKGLVNAPAETRQYVLNITGDSIGA